MICVDTSSGQFRWEFQRCCPPKIHNRRLGRNFEKHHQQYRYFQSSSEVPASPNSPHNCPSLPSQKIETSGRISTFTPPLGFRPRPQQRKWEVIDLVPQDTGLDTRRGGTGTGHPPYASSLGQSTRKKLTFALPAGRPYGLRKLQSIRNVDTSIRAERISKERRNGHSPDYQQYNGIEDNSESITGDTSIWDSNAEGIRRGRSKKRSSIKSEVPLRESSQKQQQELEYDDAEVRSRIPRNWSEKQKQQQQESAFDDSRTKERFQEAEWDYDAEASNRDRKARSRKPQAESSRWWQSNEDNGSYANDGESGEASTSFQDLLSGISMDVKDAFVFLRWGLPAAVLLVPWLMGNPMMLLFGLSFIPAANKLILPIFNQIFRTVMSGGSTPKPRRKRKQSTASPSSSRSRSQAQRPSTFYAREAPAASTSTSFSEPEADLFSSVATTIFGDPNDSLPRKPSGVGGRSNGTRRGTKRLGGWEELEEDRARSRSERWSLDPRSNRSEKKIVKRERNVFIRLILALFPFLRYWGGLM